MAMAEQAHEALGCRGISRTDFRFDESEGKEGIYLMEINTHPGMTPLSLVPKIAEHVGIGFEELIESLVQSAQCDNI